MPRPLPSGSSQLYLSHHRHRSKMLPRDLTFEAPFCHFLRIYCVACRIGKFTWELVGYASLAWLGVAGKDLGPAPCNFQHRPLHTSVNISSHGVLKSGQFDSQVPPGEVTWQVCPDHKQRARGLAASMPPGPTTRYRFSKWVPSPWQCLIGSVSNFEYEDSITSGAHNLVLR